MSGENRFVVLLSVAVTLLLLAACGTAQPTATEAPIALDTTAPTDTPLTPDTPVPMSTPAVTDTAWPTDTPIPPAESLTSPAASWPTRRHWHGMAYDPQAGRVLLFNGFDHKVMGGRVEDWRREGEKSLARDEWAYDVTQNRWEALRTVPYSFLKATAYDQQSQRVVTLGQDGTMVYNLETRSWEKTEPAEEPSHNRLGSALAYDSQSDRAILYGGYPELDDTWAYDYETNTWTEMSPEVSPPHRYDHAMAYDAESDRIILWGASEVGRAPMSEEEKAAIWAYDYDSDTWTAIESSGGPAYRGGHKMVYHSGSDRIILFGGYSLGEVYFCDDTWAYDYNANTWTQLALATHPSGRWYHQMVYDQGADKIVLFGGMAGNFVREEVSDELWIFDPVAEEWSQVLPETVVQKPPAEAATGITVTFEADRCVYHGPERVPAGQISLTLDVRDQSARDAYKVIAYTLDEGKTIEDLRAWTSVGHSPLWAQFHGMLDQPPGTLQERTIILLEGPLFLACVTDPPNYITDVLGPIEIDMAGSQ